MSLWLLGLVCVAMRVAVWVALCLVVCVAVRGAVRCSTVNMAPSRVGAPRTWLCASVCVCVCVCVRVCHQGSWRREVVRVDVRVVVHPPRACVHLFARAYGLWQQVL